MHLVLGYDREREREAMS